MPEGWRGALGGLPDLATENAEHMFIQHAPGIMLCVCQRLRHLMCSWWPFEGRPQIFSVELSGLELEHGSGTVSSTRFAACSPVALHELLSLPKLQILHYEMEGDSNITTYA